jgi:hypothetical protein
MLDKIIDNIVNFIVFLLKAVPAVIFVIGMISVCLSLYRDNPQRN